MKKNFLIEEDDFREKRRFMVKDKDNYLVFDESKEAQELLDLSKAQNRFHKKILEIKKMNQTTYDKIFFIFYRLFIF